MGQLNCAQALTTASQERRAHLVLTRPETKLFFHQERCAHLARNICMSRRLEGLTRQAKEESGSALTQNEAYDKQQQQAKKMI